jgi:hypothetical protein
LRGGWVYLDSQFPTAVPSGESPEEVMEEVDRLPIPPAIEETHQPLINQLAYLLGKHAKFLLQLPATITRQTAQVEESEYRCHLAGLALHDASGVMRHAYQQRITTTKPSGI